MNSLENKERLRGYSFNGFFLDVAGKKLSYENIILKLETWDFEILLCLIEKCPNTAKNEEIKKIFPRHISIIKAKQDTEKSISRLRKQFNFVKENYKKNNEELNHLVIETIKNEGYCLHADLEKIYDDSSQIVSQRKDPTVRKANTQPSENSINNSRRRKILWILLLVLGLLLVIFYIKPWKTEISGNANKPVNTKTGNLVQSSENNNEIVSKPPVLTETDLPTKIRIKAGNVTLDLNSGGWKELTPAQAKSEEKLSKAITRIDYEIEKLGKVEIFEVRLGVTKGPPPELDNINNYPMLNGGKPEDITNDFQNCLQLKSYKLFYFDINEKDISSSFQLRYNVNTFNAHNNPQTEFHAQVIYYSTQNLDIKIIFPKIKPFKINGITYKKKQICEDVYQTQYPPKLKNRDETVPEYSIEHPQGKELVWHIKNPEVNYVYLIEWNW